MYTNLLHFNFLVNFGRFCRRLGISRFARSSPQVQEIFRVKATVFFSSFPSSTPCYYYSSPSRTYLLLSFSSFLWFESIFCWVVNQNHNQLLPTLDSTKIGHKRNRPFPSSPQSLFQSESKCEIFVMIIVLISIWMKTDFHNRLSHLASLWNGGWDELGNGLLGRVEFPPWRGLTKLTFRALALCQSEWARTNARNASFVKSLQWK